MPSLQSHQPATAAPQRSQPQQLPALEEQPAPLAGAQAVLQLQRLAGNRAVSRLVQRVKISNTLRDERRAQLQAVLKPERYTRLSSLYFISNLDLFNLILAEKDDINAMEDDEFNSLSTNAEMEARIRALASEGHGWFGRKTYLGKAMGLVGFGGGKTGEKEDLYNSSTETSSDFSQEDENDLKDNDKEILTPSKIEITLLDADKAKFEDKKVPGGKASGSAELKAGAEGLSGKAQVSIELGKKGEAKEEKLVDWHVAGGSLRLGGKLEAFGGAKAEGKGKATATYSQEKGLSLGARGKTSAFIGLSVEGSTEVSVRAGPQVLFKTTGKAGAAFGLGGELSGKVQFENGTFSMGGKAKAAMGLGFSAQFNIEIKVGAIAAGFFSWLKNWGWRLLGY